MSRCKYNVINKAREEEPWSGIFENEELAQKWYEKYGIWHESRGHKLVFVEIPSQEEIQEEDSQQELDLEYDEL